MPTRACAPCRAPWQARVLLLHVHFPTLFRAYRTALIAAAIFAAALPPLLATLVAETTPGTRTPIAHPLALTRCTSFSTLGAPHASPCLTLLFAPNGAAERIIMASVASVSSLRFCPEGTGCTVMTADVDVVGVASAQEAAALLHDSIMLLAIDFVVILHIDKESAGVSYEIWTNASLPPLSGAAGLDPAWTEMGVSSRLLGLQLALDGALIAERMHVDRRGTSVGLLRASIQPYPDWVGGGSGGGGVIGGQRQRDGLSALAGACLVAASFSAPLLAHALFAHAGVDGGTLVLLRTWGLVESAHTLSLLLALAPIALAAAVVMEASGRMFTQLALFHHVAGAIHTLMLASCALALSGQALACAACARSRRCATMTISAQLLSALALSSLPSSLGVISLLWSPLVPRVVPFLLALLVSPALLYGRLVWRILVTVGGSAATAGASNPAFMWESLITRSPADAAAVDIATGQPIVWRDAAPLVDLALLWVLLPIYVTLAALAAQVTAPVTHHERAPLPLLFLCNRRYWFRQREGAADTAGDAIRAHKLSVTLRVDSHTRLRACARFLCPHCHIFRKPPRTHTLIDNVSFAVPRGEITALLSSGAAPATLLHVFAGLTKPSHGDALICGVSVSNTPWHARRLVGASLKRAQHGGPPLWGALTLSEHITLQCRFSNDITSDEAVKDILTCVGLGNDSLFHMAHTASDNERRALSLALAILCRHPLLLLEDVFCDSDDAVSQRRLWHLLRRLTTSGTTIIFSTPSPAIASRASRVAIFSASGSLRICDPPAFITRSLGMGHSVTVTTRQGAPIVPLLRLLRRHVEGAFVLALNGRAVSMHIEEEGVASGSGSGEGGSGEGGLLRRRRIGRLPEQLHAVVPAEVDAITPRGLCGDGVVMLALPHALAPSIAALRVELEGCVASAMVTSFVISVTSLDEVCLRLEAAESVSTTRIPIDTIAAAPTDVHLQEASFSSFTAHDGVHSMMRHETASSASGSGSSTSSGYGSSSTRSLLTPAAPLSSRGLQRSSRLRVARITTPLFCSQALAILCLRLHRARQCGCTLFGLAAFLCALLLWAPRVEPRPRACAAGFLAGPMCEREAFIAWLVDAVVKKAAHAVQLHAGTATCVRPDWRQAQFSDGWEETHTDTPNTPLPTATVFHYVDAESEDAGGTRFSAFSHGACDGAISYLDAAAAYGARSGLDIAAHVLQGQVALAARATPIVGLCSTLGEWYDLSLDTDGVGTWLGWQVSSDRNDRVSASEVLADAFPDLAVVIHRAHPRLDSGRDAADWLITPAFEFELLHWALQVSPSREGQLPRAAAYAWTRALSLNAEGTRCDVSGLAPIADDAFTTRLAPTSVTILGLSNSFYRTAASVTPISSPLRYPSIRAWLVQMPQIQWASVAVDDSFVGGLSIAACLWPLIVLTQYSSLCRAVSVECEHLSLPLSSAGIRLSAHFFGHMLHVTLAIGTSSIAHVIVGRASGAAAFVTVAGAVPLTLLILSTVIAGVGWVTLLGAAFHPRAIVPLTHTLMLLTALTSLIIHAYVQPWTPILTWCVPLLSITRASALVFTYGAGVRGELSSQLLATILHGVVAFLIGVTLIARQQRGLLWRPVQRAMQTSSWRNRLCCHRKGLVPMTLNQQHRAKPLLAVCVRSLLLTPTTRRAVSFEVRAGEVIVISAGEVARRHIVGILVGALPFTSGHVVVMGQVLLQRGGEPLSPDVRLCIEETTRQVHLSARQFLMFIARAHGLGRMQWDGLNTAPRVSCSQASHERLVSYVQTAAASVCIDLDTTTPVAELAQGERARVSLAAALVGGPPRLLIVEAPTLDAPSRRIFYAALQRAADEGAAVIVITLTNTNTSPPPSAARSYVVPQ